MNDAGVTNIQLMTILGNLYGFEVRPQAETGEATAPDLLADIATIERICEVLHAR